MNSSCGLFSIQNIQFKRLHGQMLHKLKIFFSRVKLSNSVGMVLMVRFFFFCEIDFAYLFV